MIYLSETRLKGSLMSGLGKEQEFSRWGLLCPFWPKARKFGDEELPSIKYGIKYLKTTLHYCVLLKYYLSKHDCTADGCQLHFKTS